MQLTILGSGGAVVRLKRRAPSFYLRCRSTSLVIDCGWGLPDGLLEAKIEIQDIDHFLISHPHADHFSSLVPLIQSIYVTGMRYPKKLRKKPLYLHGYPGFKENLMALRHIMCPGVEEAYPIEIYEYENEKRSFGAIVIEAREVQHEPNYFRAVSFRIEAEGKALFYSGDACYDETLAALAKSADLGLFESSTDPRYYREHGPARTHISPQEAGMLAQKAKVKKLVLFHLYDTSSEDEYCSAAKDYYKGEVVIPKDLQVMEI